VYVEGVEIPRDYKCENIHFYIKEHSYREIIDKYIENDVFIHMGSHEGLGLGFYEALYCGTPILTMNWIPNNELVIDYYNGWLIDCSYGELNDNNVSLINRGIINENTLKDKIIEIITSEKSIEIINNTFMNKDQFINKNKDIFYKNLKQIIG
jgi:glycosyltransferase involved in cell wall biosynthesis